MAESTEPSSSGSEGPRLALARNGFAWPHPAERRDSLARFPSMPVQEMQKSSAIERVGYNAATRELRIWFAGGRRYIYSGVSADLYRELCEAHSAGQFVNATVKGQYPCRSEPPRRRYFD